MGITQDIKLLCDVSSVSGFEDAGFSLVKKMCQDFANVTCDMFNNIFIIPKLSNSKKIKVLLESHFDEVGFMVQTIDDNGLINFINIGSINYDILPGTEVTIINDKGEYVFGVINSIPVHYAKQIEKIGTYAIDIGCNKKEEVVNKYSISEGNQVVFDSTFKKQNDIIMGKAFDNRLGCVALINVLRSVSHLDNNVNVMGIISAQEEVGSRGIKLAMRDIVADYCICFEGAPADDGFFNNPQTSIGKGVSLRYNDRSMVANRKLLDFVVNIANKNKIQIQKSVRMSGGTDAAVINNEYGIPSVVIGIPVRYAHANLNISNLGDLQEAVKLAQLIVEKIQSGVEYCD